MSTISKKEVVVISYVSDDDIETPIYEMNDKHLLNALLKAERCGDEGVVKVLRDEILKRMKMYEQEA